MRLPSGLGWWRGAGGWLHAKLVVVALIIGYHHACAVLLRKIANGTDRHSHVWYRYFNEIPVLLLIVDAGLLLTLWVGWRLTFTGDGAYAASPARGAGLLLPWGALASALWAAAIWILLQPMQMRGTMMHG